MTTVAPGLLDPLFSTAHADAAFSEAARLQSMLDFEAALARAQARTGVIPGSAPASITSACDAALYDIAALGRAAALAGNPAIPVVKHLTAMVAKKDAEAARFVHWGATSQDVIDTGLVLQMRMALAGIESDLEKLSVATAALAARYRTTPMVGRTWLQHALPVTLGLKAAGWLDAIERHRVRLGELKGRLLVVQFGGAAGTLAALGDRGLLVAGALAEELGLSLPAVPWHAARDRFAEAATVMALLTGTLGKMARDVSLMMQTDVGEAFEPSGTGRGGSSTMPHKRNPVSGAVVLAAATRAPHLAGNVLSAMVQEHERGLGGWHAEWMALPELFRLTAGALAHMADTIEGLEVDEDRMRSNLDRTQGLIMAEAAMMALGSKIGRLVAHDLIEAACHRALAERRHLRDVLAGDPEISRHLGNGELDRLFDPLGYTGVAQELVDRALAERRKAFDTYLRQSHIVTDDGLLLHYRIDGPQDAPVLVMSNSLGTDLRMWDPQLDMLSQNFRVLRYDTRGHGRSGVPSQSYGVDRLGRDVLCLLDHLAIAKASFCGLSMGGMTGMWLGVNAPERFDRLVLCNTAAKIGTADVWNSRIAAVEVGGMGAIVNGVIQRWFTDAFVAAAPGDVRAIAAMLQATVPAGYSMACAAVRDMDQRHDIAVIRLPTLVIAGTHDLATTPQDGRLVAETVPGARFVELPAAHLSNIECRRAFTEELTGFLAA